MTQLNKQIETLEKILAMFENPVSMTLVIVNVEYENPIEDDDEQAVLMSQTEAAEIKTMLHLKLSCLLKKRGSLEANCQIS